MSRVFCTIITEEYLPYGRTLFQSIRKFDKEVDCVALVVDLSGSNKYEGFEVLALNQLSERNLISQIREKYQKNSDSLRWSLKSILMIHLLQLGKYDQVFFIDSDIHFYSDFSFLFDELGDRSFLLSPHWGCMNPLVDREAFFSHFSDGIFNGGFLGATNKGIETLKWWAEMCLYLCQKQPNGPFYVDQIYLHAFLVRNPDSRILSHRGCNVAVWNIEECKRIEIEGGGVLINREFPIVFIHFSHPFDLYKRDKLLLPYFEIYSNSLVDNGYSRNILQEAKAYFHRKSLKKLSYIQRIKRKFFGYEYIDNND